MYLSQIEAIEHGLWMAWLALVGVCERQRDWFQRSWHHADQEMTRE